MLGGSVVLEKMGKHNQRSLTFVLIPIAVFCLWLMWICTWLAQWHPIPRPELEVD